MSEVLIFAAQAFIVFLVLAGLFILIAILIARGTQGSDLEITKVGGETVVSAVWAVKVPLVYNASACLDFAVTTAK